MLEVIFLIILVLSFFGMFFTFIRKIPLILAFEFPREDAISKFKKKIKKLNPFRDFSFEIFLQKWIARVRILSLKIDNLTFHWLKKVKGKTKKKRKAKS